MLVGFEELEGISLWGLETSWLGYDCGVID
jgi:hypothetical protein